MKPSNQIPRCTYCKGYFFSDSPAKRINKAAINVRPIWKHQHCPVIVNHIIQVCEAK